MYEYLVYVFHSGMRSVYAATFLLYLSTFSCIPRMLSSYALPRNERLTRLYAVVGHSRLSDFPERPNHRCALAFRHVRDRGA